MINNLQSQYTFYGQIHDKELSNKFIEFNYQQTSIYSYLFFVFCYGIILFPLQIYSLVSYHQQKEEETHHSSGKIVFLSIDLFVIVCNLILSSYLCYQKYKQSSLPNIPNYDRTNMLSILQTLFISTNAMFLLIRYLETNFFTHCITNNTLSYDVFCSHPHFNHSVAMLFLLIPICLIHLLHEYHFFLCNIISLCCPCIALLIGALYYEEYTFVSMIFVCLSYAIKLIYDMHITQIQLFLLTIHLENAMVEKTEHVQSDEMRHMIANVAHDLKTPLASFMSGMELIGHIVHNCVLRMETDHKIRNLLEENMISILQCLENVRNTNSFMLMTINRCIDYTKASEGMKLIPKYETINLRDTLNLPILCMKNIQNKIEIHLNNIPKFICPNLITDKQWLQENILCLLSNSVKYSMEGVITITVSVLEIAYNGSSKEENIRTARYIARSNRIVPMKDISPSDSKKEISISRKEHSFHSHSQAGVTKHIRFEIEDTGIGMSDEAMASLFNPFKQTQRLAGGTGLGLYSLSKRVEALNGKYGVRKRRDGHKGSLFWFSIPYKPDDSYPSMSERLGARLRDSVGSTETEDRENWPFKSVSTEVTHANVEFPQIQINNHHYSSLKTANLALTPSSSPTSTDRWDILIVDDSPAIRKMTSMVLSKHGHRVTTADNGEEALQQIEHRWEETHMIYDVVLMDLQMPIMDGLESTRRIREQEQRSHASTDPLEQSRPHQIILGLSANSEQETTEEAIHAGVDSFLAKPFKIETFYKLLKLLKVNNNNNNNNNTSNNTITTNTTNTTNTSNITTNITNNNTNNNTNNILITNTSTQEHK